MILYLLFILFTITANGQHPHRDGRRSRQLDLGLQDISNSNDKASKKGSGDFLANGYLPPVSDSSQPSKVVGAQSQQSLKTINDIEKTLCSPPFDSIFCNLSKASKSDSNIVKPSRDLVPPFNDLEEKPSYNKESITKLIKEETTKNTIFDENFSVYSAVSHSTFQATTRKPFTKTTKFQSTTLENKPIAKEETNLNKGESTNELRSYLPPQPEFAGAAQTSVGVVRPPDQNNDHHHDHDHHHGHHHHTGDICSDAFHSFLCAPLKARKRITGALPNSLKGQSSFVQYQKVLPNPDKEPAPSNTFQNEYLPPKTTAAPVTASASNTVQSTYAPPRTTTRRIVTTTTTTTTPRPTPKFIPEPSNENDRYYLPPVTNNKIFAPAQPESTNQLFEKLQPSSTTRAPPTFSTPTPTYRTKTISRISVSTEKPISFLPVTTTFKPIVINNIVPDASFQREFSSFSPEKTYSPFSIDESRFYLPPNPSPQPAASFVSTEKKIFPTTTFVSQPFSFPTVSTFAPLPSNTILISPQPKFQPLPTVISTTVKPFSAPPKYFSSSAPIIITTTKLPVRPLPTVISTTVKPFSAAPKYFSSSAPIITTTTKLPVRPLPTIAPQPKYQSASNVISTTIKPFTTTKWPTTKYAAPSTISPAYLPSDPNFQPAAAQIDVAAVAPPGVKNPFHHGRDLCTDPFHSFLCASAKPRKRITGALPPGFRPESSNVNERVKPAPSFQNENRVKPDIPLETSPAQNVGYSYPKPINPFPSQSNSIPSTTAAPTTGYSYPKPDKIFPLPSQQKEVVTAKPVTTKKPAPPVLRTSEARVVKGYEYPKPEVSFPLPSGQQSTVLSTTSKPPTTGYSYPKPKKPFPLPTEQKEVRYSTPKPPSSSYKPVVAQPTNEVKGYQYPKPQQSFNLPDKKGYFYPKPENKLILPSESKPKSLFPQSNSNPNIFGNSGSAEFIPVNKLDKREDSSILKGLRRFGERLRKRERGN